MTRALAGRKVLVTGAGGFIGPHVVAAIVETGADVRAHIGPPGKPPARLPAAVEQVNADIADAAAMRRIAASVDVVVHLAGAASVRRSFEEPLETFNVHTQGTAVLIEACRQAGARRFIYMSSAEVYGRPARDGVDENGPVAPRSPYGAAKAAAELIVSAYAQSFGQVGIALRPFSVYGPGETNHSLVGSIVNQLRSCARVTVADIRPVRDYCFVADVARAVAQSCVADVTGFTAINIASGQGTSVLELIQAAADALGVTADIEEDVARRRPDAQEIFRLIASVERARTLLGWSAATTLREGLQQTCAQTALTR